MGTLLLLPEASSLPGPGIDEPPAAPHRSPRPVNPLLFSGSLISAEEGAGKGARIFRLWQVTSEGKPARGWEPFTFTTQVVVY